MKMNYTTVTEKYLELMQEGNQLNKASFDNLVNDLKGLYKNLEDKVKEYDHPQINSTGIKNFIYSLNN